MAFLTKPEVLEALEQCATTSHCVSAFFSGTQLLRVAQHVRASAHEVWKMQKSSVPFE